MSDNSGNTDSTSLRLTELKKINNNSFPIYCQSFFWSPLEILSRILIVCQNLIGETNSGVWSVGVMTQRDRRDGPAPLHSGPSEAGQFVLDQQQQVASHTLYSCLSSGCTNVLSQTLLTFQTTSLSLSRPTTLDIGHQLNNFQSFNEDLDINNSL